MTPSQAGRAPDVCASLAETARARVGAKLDVDNAKVCAAIDALIGLGDADVVSGNCRTACSKGCNYC